MSTGVLQTGHVRYTGGAGVETSHLPESRMTPMHVSVF